MLDLPGWEDRLGQGGLQRQRDAALWTLLATRPIPVARQTALSASWGCVGVGFSGRLETPPLFDSFLTRTAFSASRGSEPLPLHTAAGILPTLDGFHEE